MDTPPPSSKHTVYIFIKNPLLLLSGDNMIVISLPPLSDRVQWKQIAPPNPIKEVAQRLPCTCRDGLCACCTGMLLQALRSKGCMNLKYIADDFAFVFEMKMNNQVLYKNRVSGRNPKPICVNPPRFPFIQVCATFYDVYFFGRNVHACMEFGGYFEGFELFSRSFDCVRMGSQGVRIVKPEDDERPQRPESSAGNATDAIIDAGDGIEDYDENLIRFEEQTEVVEGSAVVVGEGELTSSTTTTTTTAKPTVRRRTPTTTTAPVRRRKPSVRRTTRAPVRDDSDSDEEEDEDDDYSLF